jgi:PAS domain-containing protein
MPDVVTLVLFGSISLLSAAAAVLLTGALRDRWRVRVRPSVGPVFADMPRRYEFREGYLISPIDPNDAFLPADIDRSAAFDALGRALRQLDPELPRHFAGLARRGDPFVATARFGQDLLGISGRPEGDRVTVTIGPAEARDGRIVVDAQAFEALREDAEELRAALDAARMPVWRQDSEGRMQWANAPYHALVEQLYDGDAATTRLPAPALFDEAVSPPPDPGTVRRLRLPRPDGEDAAPDTGAAVWFEVAAERRADGGLLASAMPVDRLVAAETSLRSFVQTLSKTFAQLPIGLAVFDRRRELMLFNPALVTLSTLEPLFLSQRPSLVAFLDALRDRQRMPEPKNYRDWRDEIARLEQDAEAGTYQELWSLPDGASLRVIGRPHPDGAIAFMFEDISSEVSLTRQFRGDLELCRAVIDDWPVAVAVFSGEGRLVMANAAYAALWSGDVTDTVDAPSLEQAARRWQAACAPSGLWDDIRAFAQRKTDRAPWCEEAVLRAGQVVTVRISPLAGGAMSVSFAPVSDTARRPGDPPPPLQEVGEIGDAAAAFRSRRHGGG